MLKESSRPKEPTYREIVFKACPDFHRTTGNVKHEIV